MIRFPNSGFKNSGAVFPVRQTCAAFQGDVVIDEAAFHDSRWMNFSRRQWRLPCGARAVRIISTHNGRR